jgi:hypothetical protein
MELGFNLHIDHCNVPYVIGFVCVMVMVVVLFISAKAILSKLVNREKKEDKDYFDFLESSGEDGKEEI